ncbi:MAG: family 10 glycosylhydrolase, partial [Oscillospiraceae bacterium]
IKNIDSNVVFGISPQANMENNYDEQYIDVQKWLSQKGYVDYICPQIYYGFENEKYPYAYTVKLWNEMITVDGIELYVGLAPYKIGKEDKWAGSGKNEWFATTDVLKKMVVTAREASNYAGFSLYRYDYMFKPSDSGTINAQMKKEKESLQSILK